MYKILKAEKLAANIHLHDDELPRLAVLCHARSRGSSSS